MAAPPEQQFQCLMGEIADSDDEIEELIECGDEDFLDDEDLNFEDNGAGQSAEDNKFDAIVGALEDLLISPEFEEVQSNFGLAHSGVFEEDGENKLVYTQIFEQYSNLLEEEISTHLCEAVEGFDMMEFVGMLNARKDELNGEVFDMMLTLTEFDSFKELMLSYKENADQGFKGLDLTLSTTCLAMHTNEQEDGEERPDLDMGLNITGLHSP